MKRTRVGYSKSCNKSPCLLVNSCKKSPSFMFFFSWISMTIITVHFGWFNGSIPMFDAWISILCCWNHGENNIFTRTMDPQNLSPQWKWQVPPKRRDKERQHQLHWNLCQWSSDPVEHNPLGTVFSDKNHLYILGNYLEHIHVLPYSVSIFFSEITKQHDPISLSN